MELDDIHSFLANKKNITRLFNKYGLSYYEKLIIRFNEVIEKIKEKENLLLIEEKEKLDKLKKVTEYMLSIGLNPNDLNTLKKNKNKVIKYQYIDVNNKIFVWSGKGKIPKWLTKHLEKGRSLDDFLIN